MARKKTETPTWRNDVEPRNYESAECYLSLLYSGRQPAKLVAKMKAAAATTFKAKDIFRASGLSLLGISNSQVEKDRKKIRSGVALSPVLLVRDGANGRVIVADGYHRLCAIYGFDEDELIPCRIV